MLDDILFECIDLFSGAGGTTTGFDNAEVDGRKICKVIAAVNHDRKAIESHMANHPETLHFIEDVRTLKVNKLPKYSRDVIKVLWASLECTNFSLAKGGLSREADSRTLAYSMYRYVKYLDPHIIQIENVREFMDWGPLVQKKDKVSGELLFDKNGKPVMVPHPHKKGIDFKRWVKKIKSYGYEYTYRLMNAADYGANQSRLRYFGLFVKKGFPIAFPEPTHSKNELNGLPKWKAVKELLDLQDKGKSIFDRKKSLADKTYRRIYSGLVKYVAGGEEQWLLKYNSAKSNTDINEGVSIERPSPTIATQGRLGLVSPEFLIKYHKTGENIVSTDEPSSTITTRDRLGLVQPAFIANYHHSSDVNSLEKPSPTLTTRDKLAVIHTEKAFMDEQYGCSTGKSIDEPSGALVGNPKQNLVTVEGGPWIMDTNFNNIGSNISEPSPTLLACRKHHYLVTTETGELAIEINEADTEYMIKIKQFMALYGIVAIYMRMLKIIELKRIQGFSDDYILMGNQSDQKKFIGNAVHTIIPKKWMEAFYSVIVSTMLERSAA